MARHGYCQDSQIDEFGHGFAGTEVNLGSSSSDCQAAGLLLMSTNRKEHMWRLLHSLTPSPATTWLAKQRPKAPPYKWVSLARPFPVSAGTTDRKVYFLPLASCPPSCPVHGGEWVSHDVSLLLCQSLLCRLCCSTIYLPMLKLGSVILDKLFPLCLHHLICEMGGRVFPRQG